jgi:hypothetical protein
MYTTTLFYIISGAPIIPMLVIGIFKKKKFFENRFLITFVLLISVDLLTNLSNLIFEETQGNVMIITNLSIYIQSLLIIYLYKLLDKVAKTLLYGVVLIFSLSFLSETFFTSSLINSFTTTILLTHFLIVTLGWVIIYKSFDHSSNFQFRIISALVLYNTVFLVQLVFQEKIDNSAALYDFIFICSCLLYIGLYLSYTRAIWLLQKNLD